MSAETLELVQRSVQAWRLTGGLFDPTVLPSLVRAGYDRTFSSLPPAPPPDQWPLTQQVAAGVEDVASPEPFPPGSWSPGPLDPGAEDIVVADGAVMLPAGAGFDAGGIGKGLAADLVARELMAAGAAGVCVNVGGDVRLMGESDGSDGAAGRSR